MGRDQRPGDWAAWMGAPTPASPRVHDADLEPTVAAHVPAAHVPAGDTPADDAPAEPDGPDAADAHGEADDAQGGVQRSARREVTRQRLLDAAREVFAERGVIGGSVEDICERAGFTRGAFYSNFADKDEVVEALIVREQTRLLEHLDTSVGQVEPEIAEAVDLATVLHSIVDRIVRTVPVDRQLMLVQTELEIHAIRRPDLSRQLLEVNSLFRERLGAFVAEALERNGRRLTVSPGDLVDTVIAISERSFRRAILAGDDADPDALAAAVLPGVLLALTRPVEPTG